LDRIRNFLMQLRTQLWALPALFLIGASGLAFLLLQYGEEWTSDAAAGSWWLNSGEPSTARDLLSSLLTGMMTMTSLVVSVTFVILTLSANQLGPRLISIFMRDRQIQSVIGFFIGTILYLILVLRSLTDDPASNGAPHLAVTAGSVLTVLCLLALLFYIHKIASSIIADNVVQAVFTEFRSTLEEILPDEPSEEDHLAAGASAGASWPIGIDKVGYIQVVQYDRLVELAAKRDLFIEVKVRAGHYLLRQGCHVVVHAAGEPETDLIDAIRAAFTVGPNRTPAQDPEHGIRQLVEIATRALSPGTNDPFTAKAVIDRLGAILEEFFAHGLQPRVLRDAEGRVRVRADRSDIAGILDEAFHPIRQAAFSHPSILIHMIGAVGQLAAATCQASQREALSEQLDRIAEIATRQAIAESDSRDILAAIEAARRELASAR
jgi:uncharacterized membrane protein